LSDADDAVLPPTNVDGMPPTRAISLVLGTYGLDWWCDPVCVVNLHSVWEDARPVFRVVPPGSSAVKQVHLQAARARWRSPFRLSEKKPRNGDGQEHEAARSWLESRYPPPRYTWSEARNLFLVHPVPLVQDADEFYINVFKDTPAEGAGRYVASRDYDPAADFRKTARRAVGIEISAMVAEQAVLKKMATSGAWHYRRYLEYLRGTYAKEASRGARDAMRKFEFTSRAKMARAKAHRKTAKAIRRVGRVATAAEAVAFAGNRTTGIYVYRTASQLSPTRTRVPVYRVIDHGRRRQLYVTGTGGYITDNPTEQRTFERMNEVDRYYRSWQAIRSQPPEPKGLLRYIWDAFVETWFS